MANKEFTMGGNATEIVNMIKNSLQNAKEVENVSELDISFYQVVYAKPQPVTIKIKF